MNKDKAKRESNILTMKNTAATQELAKDEKNKLNRILRSSEFQKKVGLLNEQESTLIAQLIKEGVDMEKILSEIGKLRAEAAAEGAEIEMKPAKFRELTEKASTVIGAVYDKTTGAITGPNRQPINPEKALQYADTVVEVIRTQPGSANWVKGMKVAAGVAAKNLAGKQNITKDMIEAFRELTGQALEDKIQKTAEKTPSTVENIKQILRYYPR